MKSYEILLVNDGSTDGTWPLIHELVHADCHVVAVDLSRNFGQQPALFAGLAHCRGERILILDADLQDPPELLPRMLEMMDDGADVIYGVRRSRRGESLMKRTTAAGYYRLLEVLADTTIPRDTGDFRLINRRTLDALLSMKEHHRYLRGMISWVGFRQVPICYDRAARNSGVTKYTLPKMLKYAIDGIAGFSTRPLAVASWLALATAVVGVILLVAVWARWLGDLNVPSWMPILGGMAVLSSMQLMALGVIGAYLGRLYEQSRGRPLYVVRAIVRSMSSAKPDGGLPQ
jgi:dolichol-phosphate mannosyltransferase